MNLNCKKVEGLSGDVADWWQPRIKGEALRRERVLTARAYGAGLKA
jgi:hypothetical protein